MNASASVTVSNPSGLHARPASELARLAGSLSSTVRLTSGDRTIDAASVLSVMGLAVQAGQTVTIECEGEQADQDLATVVAAFTDGLGEVHA